MPNPADSSPPERLLEAHWRLSRGSLEADRTVELPVLSGSMRPRLAVGTSIGIRPATWRDLEPGDIAVFRRGERLTAHRVLILLSVGDRAVCFQKGDLNDRGRWVRGDRIVGRVIASTDERGRDREFESAAARDRGRALASAGLRGDIVHRILSLPRKVLRWLGSR